MEQKSKYSFVNGLIAGAGIVLGFMSYGYLQFIAPIENLQGVSSTEIRVAIMLGGIVAAAAIGYEFYTKKETKIDEDVKSEDEKSKVSEPASTKQEDIAETNTELKDK